MSIALNKVRSTVPRATRWMVFNLARAVATITVIVLLVFSLPVTILGELLLRPDSYEYIPSFNLQNHIEGFREDLMEMMERQHSPVDRFRPLDSLRAEIVAEYERSKIRSEVGEAAVGFWGGVVAVCIAMLGGWSFGSTVLSAFVLILTVSIIVRILVIEILAFGEADAEDTVNRTRLELMLGWNKAILSGFRSQASILTLAILGWLSDQFYDIANEGISEYVAERRG